MPNDIDLSTEALLKHRAIAEKATPGPWRNRFWTVSQGPESVPMELADCSNIADAAHIAANSPAVVKAHIDEILRLRAEMERLNKEADYLAGVIAAAYCAQENVTHCEKTEGLPLHKLRDACAACWRKAARKAVEGNA